MEPGAAAGRGQLGVCAHGVSGSFQGPGRSSQPAVCGALDCLEAALSSSVRAPGSRMETALPFVTSPGLPHNSASTVATSPPGFKRREHQLHLRMGKREEHGGAGETAASSGTYSHTQRHRQWGQSWDSSQGTAHGHRSKAAGAWF